MVKILDTSFPEIWLRPIIKDDLPDTLEWRNNEQNRHWFRSSDLIISQQHSNFFTNNQSNSTDLIFIIENLQSKLGQISLYKINQQESSAEFGRLLVNPNFRGQGFMKAASKILLKFATTVLKLSHIYLEVKKNNTTAISIYTSLDFKQYDQQEDFLFFEYKKFFDNPNVTL